MVTIPIAASHRCDDRVFSGIAFPHVEHFIELITLSCLLEVAAAMPKLEFPQRCYGDIPPLQIEIVAILIAGLVE